MTTLDGRSSTHVQPKRHELICRQHGHTSISIRRGFPLGRASCFEWSVGSEASIISKKSHRVNVEKYDLQPQRKILW